MQTVTLLPKIVKSVFPIHSNVMKNTQFEVLSNSHIRLAVTVEAKGTLQCGVKCHQTNVTEALHAIWMLRPHVLQGEINKVMHSLNGCHTVG